MLEYFTSGTDSGRFKYCSLFSFLVISSSVLKGIKGMLTKDRGVLLPHNKDVDVVCELSLPVKDYIIIVIHTDRF